MYQNFVGAEWVTPSEFWRLRPFEIWWLYETKTKNIEKDDNSLSNDEWYELYDWVDTLND